jgi:cyclohexadieny/prephenate dehydrogenase
VSEDPLFDRIALIGLGLIGSSLGHVIKREGLAGHVAGNARTAETRAKALEIGFVDSVHEDPGDAVDGADLVILCTPLGVYAELTRQFAPRLAPGAILSDVGSVKESVIRDLTPLLPEGVHLVPGHPISGTEHSGPEAGFATLFEKRWTVLTPGPGTDGAAVDRVAELWHRTGAMIDIMDPHHHDLVLAITSHVPHLIAYNIVGTAHHLETVTESEVIKYSAAGFRDFTRIAASDPVMWRDVFLTNREAVLEMLARFSEDLTALQRAIRWGEGDALEDLFRHTRAIRRSIIEAQQHEYYYGNGEARGFFDGDGDGSKGGKRKSGKGPT